jgi:NADH:ubiquinone oxidoreductase subunit C
MCVQDYTMKLQAVLFSEPLALFYKVYSVTSQKTVVVHIITDSNVQELPSMVSIPASTTVPAI